MSEATKPEVEVPESLAQVAAQQGWPLDVVKEGLALGVNADFIERSIRAGITPDAAHERFTNYRVLGGIPPLDMSWAKVPTDGLPRARPGPRGLRLADVETGAYGFVPDRWQGKPGAPQATAKDHYLPFGSGARACLASHLAFPLVTAIVRDTPEYYRAMVEAFADAVVRKL